MIVPAGWLRRTAAVLRQLQRLQRLQRLPRQKTAPRYLMRKAPLLLV
jgi:hypothetical protein